MPTPFFHEFGRFLRRAALRGTAAACSPSDRRGWAARPRLQRAAGLGRRRCVVAAVGGRPIRGPRGRGCSRAAPAELPPRGPPPRALPRGPRGCSAQTCRLGEPAVPGEKRRGVGRSRPASERRRLRSRRWEPACASHRLTAARCLQRALTEASACSAIRFRPSVLALRPAQLQQALPAVAPSRETARYRPQARRPEAPRDRARHRERLASCRSHRASRDAQRPPACGAW